MLSEQERDEIEAQSQHYPNNRALCIEALKIVQEHRGWVSDEGIADVAEALQMTPAELEGVATFYNMIFRKPVGRHVILLCDSVSCWIMGYDRLREHLRHGWVSGWARPLRMAALPCCRMYALAPATMRRR